MITLALDASTYTGTVAVLKAGRVVAAGEAVMRGRDAEALMPAVATALEAACIKAHELTRVVCGTGPGSFTSLRIAASIAKGLALGAGCPLFEVSSLALLAAATQIEREENKRVVASDARYLAVLDALRGDAYVGGFSFNSLDTPSVILPERIVRQADVLSVAASIGATTIGPGQLIDVGPHARAVFALDALITQPVDLAGWEPRYGRKAEAQSRWEATHGQPLPQSGTRT